jgi:hypothetical protein
MQLTRSSLLAEYRLISRFHEVRERLLAMPNQDHLTRPLAFWALPTDRGLPLAFMGRTLKDILSAPFESLMATPGVGHKKMIALIALLERAATSVAEDGSTFPIDRTLAEMSRVERGGAVKGEESFDAGKVSEATWAQWCQQVKRYHLEEELLGRFSPCLDHLPRVLWHTPLNAYCDLSLEQIRKLKTHGEKRVQAVIEVFHELHNVLSGLGGVGNLAVRIQPRVAGQVENWLLAALERPELPCPDELARQLIVPLVEQVRHDLGGTVGDLVRDRLGIAGPETSVRQTARELGLTRARIYQLFGDAAEVISVRWPEGHYLVNHLADRIRAEARDQRAYDQFFTAVDVLFPTRRSAELTSPESPPAGASSERRAG